LFDLFRPVFGHFIVRFFIKSGKTGKGDGVDFVRFYFSTDNPLSQAICLPLLTAPLTADLFNQVSWPP